MVDWFVVAFDADVIELRVSPPGRDAWQATVTWSSIQQICFRAEGLDVSDGIYLFTENRPQSYAIPTEADGGSALWSEILRRGLFDASLAIEAAMATSPQTFCWPANTGSA